MQGTSQSDWQRPVISILVAARNEETTILDCLQAIAQLDCSAGYVEVLVGNDQSTDQTGILATNFSQQYAHFRVVTINENRFGLQGKANVLAQLAHYAQGQYLFFTDADTQVPAGWLIDMERQFNGNMGILTGVTLPEGSAFFHLVQAVDWLYNLTLTHIAGSIGVPITAMGNNMAVSRQAYDAIGGYESLPFSVTEDFALFQAIVQKGYRFRNLLTEQVLARTKPVDTVRDFLQQRKRWMRGAMRLPRWIVLALYSQYLAGPLLFVLGWFMPALAISLYLSRLLIQTMILSFGISRLKQTQLWPYVLVFDVYQLIVGPLSVIYYWLPTGIEWKGRKYIS